MDYHDAQLARLGPSVGVKLSSVEGTTNWLNLNRLCIEKLIIFLNKKLEEVDESTNENQDL